MTPKADLAQLYWYLERLQEIEGISSELIQKRDSKLDAIAQEVQRLEDFAATLYETVCAIDLKEVGKWRDETLKRYTRYNGTEIQSQLDGAIDYLDRLRDFAARLEYVESRGLRTQEDVGWIKAQLSEIGQEFGPQLNADHICELQRFDEEIDAEVQRLQQDAVEWLEGLEREFQADESLTEYKKELEHLPAFLPVECQTRLAALRDRAQDREDQDLVAQIEQLFQSLATPQKRQECLNRLQQLISEEAK
jgi:hypothetical protein